MKSHTLLNSKGETANKNHILAAITALAVVIAGGTFAFHTSENWTVWKSFFFTLITVTTVGYDASGLSYHGQHIAAVLILGGIGTATYAIGVIIQYAVTAQFNWRKQMKYRIKNLENHYVICGFGRIGRTICKRLEKANLEFIVIDNDSRLIEEATSLGYLSVTGNATEDEILMQAGIKKAQGIVCAVNSDSHNIVITLGASELKPGIKIYARADEDGAARKLKRAGATHIVSPFRTGAVEIANAITHPNLSAVLNSKTSCSDSFQMSEVTVSNNSAFAGHPLGDIKAKKENSLVFVAIRLQNKSIVVGPSYAERIFKGDVIIVAGSKEAVNQVSLSIAGTSNKGFVAGRKELTSWEPASPV
jgi:voltage-gated potassium channel